MVGPKEGALTRVEGIKTSCGGAASLAAAISVLFLVIAYIVQVSVAARCSRHQSASSVWLGTWLRTLIAGVFSVCSQVAYDNDVSSVVLDPGVDRTGPVSTRFVMNATIVPATCVASACQESLLLAVDVSALLPCTTHRLISAARRVAGLRLSGQLHVRAAGG